MNKSFTKLLTLASLIALTISFSACDDDEPPTKPKLSMKEATLTVNEAVGTISVEVVLDKPASKDIVIEYDLEGTALDIEAAGTQAAGDYEIDGDRGELEIEKGQTSGTIEINVYNDVLLESDETIEVSIDDVDSKDVEITAENKIVITITNDDSETKATFVNSSMTAKESDGLIEVEVKLDKAYPSDVTYNFELAGTAIDTVAGTTEGIHPRYWDYYVEGSAATITIPAGQTSASIKIQLFTDFTMEDRETIEITLKEDAGHAISTNGKITINVDQEDGKVIFLGWAEENVDMDMVLHIKQSNGEFRAVAAELWKDTDPELMIIPSVIESASFGTSYVYYSGGEGDLNFKVRFIDFINNVFEPEATQEIFEAKYTKENKNKYDTSGLDWIVVQTFDQVEGALANISAIVVPTAGSRMDMKTSLIPEAFKKSKWRLNPYSFKN
jgi:hypothetical protein